MMPIPRCRLLLVFLGVLPMIARYGAAQSTCPANAHVDRVETSGNVRTTHCKCNDGYETAGNGCVRSTTMRAQTRAECVRAAGEQLKADLAKCKSPVIDCLTSAGVMPKEAICAASALVVALDPSKATVLGAAIAFGDKLYESADVCGPTWGQCQGGPLRLHQQAVNLCPQN